jgi:hypothetical protein
VRIILFNKILWRWWDSRPKSDITNLDQGARCRYDLGTGKSTYGVSGKKKLFSHSKSGQRWLG